MRQFALRLSTRRRRHSILGSARDGMAIAIITMVGGDTLIADMLMVAMGTGTAGITKRF